MCREFPPAQDTMPFTQADADALRARIVAFAGVQQTTYDNQSTSFDLKGAREMLAQMEAEIAAASRLTRYRLAATSKGV